VIKVSDATASTGDLSALAYGSLLSSASVTQSSGDESYYLFVQARTASGAESPVKQVSAILDNTPPALTGLQNTEQNASVALLSWNWGCTQSPCTYRFKVDTQPTATLSGNYVADTSKTQTGAGGQYFLHIQAKDQAGNESPVAHYYGWLSGSSYQISGSVTFDWVPAGYTVSSGGSVVFQSRLFYEREQQLPARRVLVEAIEPAAGNAVIGSTATDDAGNYSIYVPNGKTIKVRVQARMTANSYVRDQVAGSPEFCDGASWDFRVVDNTQNRAIYVLTSQSSYSAATSGVNFTPALTRSAGAYTDRSAAPFAILDTVLRELELVCQASPAVSLPLLDLNWSVNNSTDSGDKTTGRISTSHYTVESVGGQARPSVYILGKENSDTDEYDDHVVAHEFGHYLEHQLYRSDSIGGEHSLGQMLDPRVAFGEGFGNAISAMTFSDSAFGSRYVDTYGSSQSSGFSINVDQAPVSGDRSIYSETSVQHLLWKLFSNRKAIDSTGAFSRIHQVLASDHVMTSGLTNLLGFAAFYRARYGTDESLNSLWTGALNSSWNALCVGVCPNFGNSGTLDIFDQDGDLGSGYSSALRYPAGGTAYSAAFWNLYASIPDSSAHSRTSFGAYSYPENKMGFNRWYRYSHVGASRVVTVSVPVTSACNGSDALDMAVYRLGQLVAIDESTSGCPTVSFSAEQGQDYVVVVMGYATEVSSFSVTVQ
jgi:hypothetical protein